MALKEVEPKNIYVRINVPDYTVQRKNRDSTVLETDLNVMEGTTPTYNGATPTRSGYDFTGWNPTPAPIYADTNYTAQFVVSAPSNKGPCPTGFHVPTSNEWGIVSNAMNYTFSRSANEWLTLLKLPMCGIRTWSNGSVANKQSAWNYWTCDAKSTIQHAKQMSNTLIGDAQRINGQSIRPFKDTYATPDSSWTVLYGTLGSNGIFYNSSLGLISIKDSTDMVTMADKNLGATAVFTGSNYSDATCGYYYQWGNNYGFPASGSVATSSTQVNASAYGPSNPYSSSTFIIGSSYWDTSNNTNLWGGSVVS